MKVMMKMIWLMNPTSQNINPFFPNVPFCYTLKTPGSGFAFLFVCFQIKLEYFL